MKLVDLLLKATASSLTPKEFLRILLVLALIFCGFFAFLIFRKALKGGDGR